MQIESFTPEHPLWPACVAHLERLDMARWVISEDGQPVEGVYFLGAIEGDEVIGHLSIKVQQVVVPATAWSGGAETPLSGPDGAALCETFVQTFGVDESHRRQGYGRALQQAALALTRDLGAYQMRSWSSLDKPANYALKLNLGFAVHPAVYETASGLQISGVYFVKAV